MSVPYIVGNPIKNPNNFYGFHDLVSNIYDIVDGRQTQSVSLLGLGKSGKTSLLHHLADQTILRQHVSKPDDYVVRYLDFSTCKTPVEFYQKIYKTLLDQLTNTPIQEPTLSVPFKAEDIESLLSHFPNRRFVLLLDELDHLKGGAFNRDFLSELRWLASGRDSELAYVTASYYRPDQLEAGIGYASTSPFSNIFHKHLHLSGLSPIEARELICRPAAQEGIIFSDDEVESIQGMAGTLPILLQMSACKWFVVKRDRKFLTSEEIQNELIEEASPFFEGWWRDLDEENRLLLGQIAQMGNVSDDSFQNPASKEGLRFLKNYGLVIEEEGTLRINGLVLATWICERIARYPGLRASQSITEVSQENKVGSERMKTSVPKIFISYSHVDEKYMTRLVSMLKPLEKQGIFEIWHDREITAGNDWYQDIQNAINTCDMALLLVSIDFLNSRFIQEDELPRMLQLRKERGLRVIPIIVRHCTWNNVPILKDLQALPKDGRPVIIFKGAGQPDRIWTEIVERIEELAKTL